MCSVLVICIGNLGRGDDGVAHHVADALEACVPADIRIITAHQLDIAMAADLAEADVAIFVDAAQRTEPLVETIPLNAADRVPGGHAPDPEGLLGMALHLYGRAPRAWLVACAAPEMPHHEGLSETAEAASAEATSVIRALLASERGDDLQG